MWERAESHLTSSFSPLSEHSGGSFPSSKTIFLRNSVAESILYNFLRVICCLVRSLNNSGPNTDPCGNRTFSSLLLSWPLLSEARRVWVSAEQLEHGWLQGPCCAPPLQPHGCRLHLAHMFHGFGSFWRLQMEEGWMCRHALPWRQQMSGLVEFGRGSVWLGAELCLGCPGGGFSVSRPH